MLIVCAGPNAQRDSNPRFDLEKATSWASGRWGQQGRVRRFRSRPEHVSVGSTAHASSEPPRTSQRSAPGAQRRAHVGGAFPRTRGTLEADRPRQFPSGYIGDADHDCTAYRSTSSFALIESSLAPDPAQLALFFSATGHLYRPFGPPLGGLPELHSLVGNVTTSAVYSRVYSRVSFRGSLGAVSW